MRLRESLLQAVLAGLVGFAAAMWTMADSPEQSVSPAPQARVANPGEVAHERAARHWARAARIEHLAIDAREARATPTAPLPDPEVAIQNVRDHASEREGIHGSEAVDAAWADQTEVAVAKGLEPVAEEAGFDVLRIDCRTESCRIDLSWASYDHARLEADRLVDAVRAVSCGIDVPLLPPSDPAAAYESAFYLDCSRPRPTGFSS